MPTANHTTSPAPTIHGLRSADLQAVVAIDAELSGFSRRRYFERRLTAAQRDPSAHMQLAMRQGNELGGYLLARVLRGEFGRAQPILRLETIGVAAAQRRAGVARALLHAVVYAATQKGVRRVQTTALWTDFGMLAWLAAEGFELADQHVLECAVNGGALHTERDDVLADDAERLSASAGAGYATLARDRAEVRSMNKDDLEAMVRIDREITGGERRDYMRSRLDTALSDSAIAVSLTARIDDTPAGYLMASVDTGDFGRTQPTATLDMLGVDPRLRDRGVGRALLSQWFANLGALRVERAETLVAASDLPLTGFLQACGFKSAQRLVFERG